MRSSITSRGGAVGDFGQNDAHGHVDELLLVDPFRQFHPVAFDAREHDLKSGAFTFYFARSIRPIDYLFGTVMTDFHAVAGEWPSALSLPLGLK